jgi:hypothetical protein
MQGLPTACHQKSDPKSHAIEDEYLLMETEINVAQSARLMFSSGKHFACNFAFLTVRDLYPLNRGCQALLMVPQKDNLGSLWR